MSRRLEEPFCARRRQVGINKNDKWVSMFLLEGLVQQLAHSGCQVIVRPLGSGVSQDTGPVFALGLNSYPLPSGPVYRSELGMAMGWVRFVLECDVKARAQAACCGEQLVPRPLKLVGVPKPGKGSLLQFRVVTRHIEVVR